MKLLSMHAWGIFETRESNLRVMMTLMHAVQRLNAACAACHQNTMSVVMHP